MFSGIKLVFIVHNLFLRLEVEKIMETILNPKKEFSIPKLIVEAACNGNLVLFCGAGVSTENRDVLPFSFYDSIAEILKIEDCDLSFPDLMSKMEEQPNGRQRLIETLNRRITFINSFEELRRISTKFHRVVKTIPQINTIITTNWDNNFEEICGATPYVFAKDIPLWNSTFRRVLKIHGSITNISSIVASRKDYDECLVRFSSGSVLSAKLIELMTTKTVVFVGFSFGDYDFNHVLEMLKFDLDDYMQHVFFVTLGSKAIQSLSKFNHTRIVADGTDFLIALRNEMVESGALIPIEHFDFVNTIYDSIVEVHNHISNILDGPISMYPLSYQDGLIHALSRQITDKTGLYYSGKYLDDCIATYDEILKKLFDDNSLVDYTYCLGYLNGLKMLKTGETALKDTPLLILPRNGKIRTYEIDRQGLSDFLEDFKKVKSGRYYTFAKSLWIRYTGGASDTSEYVYHHLPTVL